MAHHNLDLLDKKILRLIADDARIPFLEVARSCNVSGAAIHQRIQKLTNLGILKGSQFVIDPEKVGYETCAYVGLYLQNPASFDDVVEELKKIPEVVECHYTTGGFDMFIKLYARNNHHLLNVIHDKLQPLGLSRSETIISFNAAINRQIPISELPIDEEEDEDEDVKLWKPGAEIEEALRQVEEPAKKEKKSYVGLKFAIALELLAIAGLFWWWYLWIR